MPRPLRHRRRSGSSRPSKPSRTEKTTVLIVCEGQKTEYHYFCQLKQEACVKKGFRVTVKPGKGGSRQQVAQLAVQCKERADDLYDAVWCVMDVEHPEGLPAMREALAYLKGKEILPALSNPAFEVWLLAHFERTGAVFADCSAVVKRLDKHWHQQFRAAYDKADERIYRWLADRVEQAIANAEWVRKHHHSGKDAIDSNSSTEVDLLVGSPRNEGMLCRRSGSAI